MQTTIVKWGNSQGIRIPKALLQNVQLAENDTVDVIFENKSIIITKSAARKHKTTKERLLEYNRNYRPQKEIDWGSPVGKEQW